MNDRQAGALKRVLEALHPDLAVTVTPSPGGVEVTMTGPAATPGSPAVGDVRLVLGDDSPYLWRLLASLAAFREREGAGRPGWRSEMGLKPEPH